MVLSSNVDLFMLLFRLQPAEVDATAYNHTMNRVFAGVVYYLDIPELLGTQGDAGYEAAKALRRKPLRYHSHSRPVSLPWQSAKQAMIDFERLR
jgi:hypothetical protein